MYKLVIISMLMFSTSVFGETIYFHFDAESNVEDQDCSNGGWVSSSHDPPSVRKTTGAEPVYSGAYSLRHSVVGFEPFKGKVIRAFFVNDAWNCDGIDYSPDDPNFPNDEAYFSSWYYLETDITNDESRNFMQWKIDFNTGVDGTNTGVILFMGPVYANGLIQWAMWSTGGYIDRCKLSYGDFPDYQWAGQPCWFRQASGSVVEFPRQQWVHIESYLKMTDGNAELKVWQDGTLIFDISDRDFNLLHGSDDGILWSNNTALYWGIGAYQNGNAQPQELILYTDDAMVTDYPVHQNIGPGSSFLSPPTGFRIDSSSP